MADEPDDAEVEIPDAVEVGVAAAAGAGRPAEHVPEDPFGAHTPNQIGAEVPVHGGDHVLGTQRHPGTDRDGLVTATAEGPAEPAALFPHGDHLLVEGSGELHPGVHLDLGARIDHCHEG